MKIKYIKGDLFKTQYDIIIHGCNRQGVMGSGVAKIVKESWTNAYDAYISHHKEFDLKMGEVVWGYANKRIIGNCITQDFYGRTGDHYVDYEAIKNVFKEVNSFCLELKYLHVAMPMIGSGLGGGDWSIIEGLIEEEAIDFQPVVYQL